MSEVLITDWCVLDADDMRFLCGAQWPRKHSFFRPGGGRHNTLLIAESIRQAGTLLAHVALGVPEDDHFVMDGVHVDVTGDAMAREIPAEVVLDVRVPEVVRRGGRIRRLRLEVDLQCDDAVVARASLTIGFVPARTYERVRWRDHPADAGPAPEVAPLPPAVVGVNEEDDVVIGPPTDQATWPLRVPSDHPTFFDHWLDHVPGMLVLEAMRQAARAWLNVPEAQMMRCDGEFERYLDLDAPVSVTVGLLPSPPRPGAITVLVRFQQHGHKAAEGVVVMSRPDEGLTMMCAPVGGAPHPVAEPGLCGASAVSVDLK